MARVDTSSLNVAIKKSKTKTFKTGDIGSKMAASAKFQLELLNRIHGEDKKRIQVAGLKYIMNYFEGYVDNVARRRPDSLHHVYEPGKVGDKGSRLFEANITTSAKPVLTYRFKESRVPGKSGYVFRNKAFIMEEGLPVTIVPKNAKRLVFEVDGNIVSSEKVVVSNPGGDYVQGSFVKIFNEFMSTMANIALQDMQFFSRIEKGIENESRIALRRISKGEITNMAALAASSSNKIVRSL